MTINLPAMAARFALALLLLFAAHGLFAQNSNCLSIHIGQVAGQPGDTVLVPVEVDGFTKVISMQFSLAYDASKLEVVAVDLGNNPLKLDSTLLGLSYPGLVRISWFNLATASLADETRIFNLRMRIKTAQTGLVPINLFQPIGIGYEVFVEGLNDWVEQKLLVESGGISVGHTSASPLRLTGLCSKPVVCTNQTGSVQYSVKGGIPPYSFQWKGPQNYSSTQQNPDNLVAGRYTLTVTDQEGNTTSGVVDLYVEKQSAVTSVAVISQPSACGFIECIRVSGNKGLIAWGDTTSAQWERCDLAKGFHTITLTDIEGCEVNQDLLIKNDPVNIDVQYEIKYNCATSSLATISIISLKPNQNLSYLWSTGQTTATVDSMSVGTYYVTITNQAGCTRILSIYAPGASIIAFSTLKDVDCEKGLPGSISIQGFNDIYSYKWSNGATTNNLVDLKAGNYTVTLTNSYGCSDVRNYEIKSSQYKLEATLKLIDCAKETLGSISLKNTHPSNYYYWSNGETTQSIQGLKEDYYHVTVTNDYGCYNTNGWLMYAYTGKLDFGVEHVNCTTDELGSITISPAPPSMHYTWSTGDTTSYLNNLQPGEYIVTVNSDFGCAFLNKLLVESKSFWKFGLATSYKEGDTLQTVRLKHIESTYNPVFPIEIEWFFGRKVVLNERPANGVLDSLVNIPPGDTYLTITDSKGCTQEVYSDIPLYISKSPEAHPIPWLYVGKGIKNGCVGIYARNFEDITAAQFSISWDTTNLILNKSNTKFFTVFNEKITTYPDRLRFDWEALGNQAVSWQNDSLMFEVCFYPKTPNVQQGAVFFTAKTNELPEFEKNFIQKEGFVGRAGKVYFQPASYEEQPQAICDYGMEYRNCGRPGPPALVFTWCDTVVPFTDVVVKRLSGNFYTNVNFNEMGINTCTVQGQAFGDGILVNIVNPPYDYQKCLWPGDVDNHGMCNAYDFVYLGLGFGADEGPARANATINWTGLEANDWQTKPNWYIKKYQDTNGDGKINLADTLAVVRNWDKVQFYNFSYQPPFLYRAFTDPVPPYDAPLGVAADTLITDTTSYLPVLLGDAGHPIENLHGLAFAILYDQDAVAPGIRFEGVPGWMGEPGIDYLVFQRDYPQIGRLEVAVIRTDSTEAHGFGPIGRLRLMLQDEMFEKAAAGTEIMYTPVNVVFPLAMMHRGTMIKTEGLETAVPVVSYYAQSTTAVTETQAKQVLQVYPNPASETLRVLLPGANLTSLELITAAGQVVRRLQLPGGASAMLHVSDLPAGAYMLRAASDKGVVTRLVMVK